MARAYQIATQEGLLDATVGRGTFVARNRPRFGADQALIPEAPALLRPPVAPGHPLIDLRSPQLPDVGQNESMARALEAMIGAGFDYLGYPGLRRDGALRAAYADWLADRCLGPISGEDVVLSHGGQNAICLALQCCLKGPRPQVMLEELAYPGFRHAARLTRAEVVPVVLEFEAEGRAITVAPEPALRVELEPNFVREAAQMVGAGCVSLVGGKSIEPEDNSKRGWGRGRR